MMQRNIWREGSHFRLNTQLIPIVVLYGCYEANKVPVYRE